MPCQPLKVWRGISTNPPSTTVSIGRLNLVMVSQFNNCQVISPRVGPYLPGDSTFLHPPLCSTDYGGKDTPKIKLKGNAPGCWPNFGNTLPEVQHIFLASSYNICLNTERWDQILIKDPERKQQTTWTEHNWYATNEIIRINLLPIYILGFLIVNWRFDLICDLFVIKKKTIETGGK